MVGSEKTAPKPPGRMAKTSGGAAAVKVKLNKKKHIPQHMHSQRKAVGHSGDRRNKNGNVLIKGKAKKTTPMDDEPFVVVITNVENDFAKVHQDFLPRYCCLNEAPRKSTNTANANAENRQCHYNVTARTETRSVEVSVYGKADADVSTIFQSVRAVSENHKSNPKGNGTRATNKTEGALVKSVQSPSCSSTSNDKSATLFATLGDMALALRHKPYFTHPPQFFLNIPGKDDGEVSRQAKGPGGALDALQDKSTVDTANAEGEAHGEENGATKKTESTCDKVLNGAQRLATRQADMVTVVASTSTRITTKEIRYQMRDIPGFVNCWLLYPQHFRVVFATKMALFKAKQLLDQFEVDSHVRVSLTLPDSLGREFAEFVAAEEIVS